MVKVLACLRCFVEKRFLSPPFFVDYLTYHNLLF